jgi:acetyl-CoA carboxylase carboxyl transferase subunit beta
MSWLSKSTPGVNIKPLFAKRDTPGDLWIKCPKTGELLYKRDLEQSQWVTPAGVHLRIGPQQRFRYLFDNAKWTEIDAPSVMEDPLGFTDDKPYVERLKSARAKTGRVDAMAIGHGKIGGVPTLMIAQDFEFLGGSLGMAAGEAFIVAAEEAVARKSAFVCVAASGGARMQEGTLSLMQLARTTLALQEVKQAGLPYVCIIADPTSGGVTASYAMLGDVHISEPNAFIGFSGPRVIEQTIRQKLPAGFQRAEHQHEKGMVDIVVDRREMKAKLASILSILMATRAKAA